MIEKRNLFISSSFYSIKYLNVGPETYFRNPKVFLEGQKHFQDSFPTDIVNAPIFLAGESEVFGGKFKFSNDTGPVIKEKAYLNKSFLNTNINEILKSNYYEYMIETVQRLSSYFNNKKIIVFVTSPMDYGLLTQGIIEWIELMLFDKKKFNEELKAYIRIHEKFKDLLVKAGADIIATSNVLLNNRIIPEHIIKKDIIPFLKKEMDHKIPMMIHSTFMPVSESIKNLNELDSTAGYIINESDDILKTSKKLNRNQLIAGNLSSEYLYKKLPKVIEEKTFNLMKKMQSYDNFIIATAGADLNLKTTEEQIKAIYKGIKNYTKGQ